MHHRTLPYTQRVYLQEQGVNDPGRMNGRGWQREEGGNAERTGRDRRKNWRWRREVRVTAAIKGSG